jgi:predicted  nucleic acid-binding Zn-ribbon protein
VRRTIGVLTLVLVAAGAGLSVRARAAAQATRATDQDVLPALLIEVRGLRAAMEQMASAGPQVQLALGRLQLQEQRVNNLLRRMEGIQNELGGASQEFDRTRQEITRMEGALKSVGLGAEERDHIESILPELRGAAGRALAKVQRLQVEESGLSQGLASEQGRWTEINQRMEELERALTRK